MMLKITGFPAVIRALWVIGTLFLLWSGSDAPAGHPMEPFMVSYLGMLLASAPTGLIVVPLEQQLRAHDVITSTTPMLMQWGMLWSLTFVIGYFQWFLLLPLVIQRLRRDGKHQIDKGR